MGGSLRGVPCGAAPVWLEAKLPSAVRGYRFELGDVDAALVTSMSLAAAPSGTGELAVSALAFASGVVTFVCGGGQPGRVYTLLLTVTRSDGLVSEVRFFLRVEPVLVTDTAQLVPSIGFGTAVTWTHP